MDRKEKLKLLISQMNRGSRKSLSDVPFVPITMPQEQEAKPLAPMPDTNLSGSGISRSIGSVSTSSAIGGGGGGGYTGGRGGDIGPLPTVDLEPITGDIEGYTGKGVFDATKLEANQPFMKHRWGKGKGFNVLDATPDWRSKNMYSSTFGGGNDPSDNSMGYGIIPNREGVVGFALPGIHRYPDGSVGVAEIINLKNKKSVIAPQVDAGPGSLSEVLRRQGYKDPEYTLKGQTPGAYRDRRAVGGPSTGRTMDFTHGLMKSVGFTGDTHDFAWRWMQPDGKGGWKPLGPLQNIPAPAAAPKPPAAGTPAPATQPSKQPSLPAQPATPTPPSQPITTQQKQDLLLKK